MVQLPEVNHGCPASSCQGDGGPDRAALRGQGCLRPAMPEGSLPPSRRVASTVTASLRLDQSLFAKVRLAAGQPAPELQAVVRCGYPSSLPQKSISLEIKPFFHFENIADFYSFICIALEIVDSIHGISAESLKYTNTYLMLTEEAAAPATEDITAS